MKLRMIVLVLALLALFSASVGGYSYYSAVKDAHFRTSEQQAFARVAALKKYISLSIDENLKAVRALAGLKEIGSALARPDEANLMAADHTLKLFRDSLEADVCYIMDRQGNTLASSNRDEEDSFVGRNYAFRPYFQQAIQGRAAVHMAVGVTSGRRGGYYSHPVFAGGDPRPAGVAVIKKPLEHMEGGFCMDRDSIWVLAAPDGMVFAAGKPEWRYHFLWPVSPERAAEIAEKRQFGKGPWPTLGLTFTGENSMADRTGNRYLFHQAFLEDCPGWRILYLIPYRCMFRGYAAPLFRKTVLIVLALCLLTGGMVLILYKKASREIGWRKKAEQALKESETRYRQFFEGDFSGAYISKPDGHLIACNPSFARIFGLASPEEAMETDLNSVYCGSSVRLAFLKRLKEERKVEYYESEMCRADGTLIYTVENAVGVFDKDGNLSEIRGYIMDITEQRNLEAQLRQAQKLEAVGTLAGGIAHDFNNLLMAIEGNTSLMLHGIPPEHPHYDKLASIEKYVRSGSKLTSQLLGYACKGRYEPRSLSLNEVVRETIGTIGRTRKDVCIHTDFASDLATIEADRSQIEQILLNLYVNAFDAMPEGGNFFLATRNVPHTALQNKICNPGVGDYVLLEITDTGEGMDRETLARIFDPFFTTKKMGRGTGLGLASVYGIVKNHNGHIHVVSEPGGGSAFSIYFQASERAARECAPLPETTSDGSGTVLLVDDEEMVREVGAEMLDVFGYTVLQAENGRKAVEIYDEKKDDIDLVILDMIMPEMSGREVYERIKQVNPHIRVLLSSGYSIDSQARTIMDQGCDGFIQKPFNLRTLSHKISEILGK